MKRCPACDREFKEHLIFCPYDGKTLIAQAKPDVFIGTTLDNKYRIEEMIGEGGMGKVYRATHVHMDHTLAIKLLHPHLSSDHTAVERFRREARSAAQIHHPNAVVVTDFGVTLEKGVAYLVMEFLKGVDLRKRIEQQKQLDYDEMLLIVEQTCSALDAAHAKGIIHRDLKPDNIWLVEPEKNTKHVKVLDFGIAKLQSTTEMIKLTQQGMIVGTPHYMSPEQCRGEELDVRSDIYSLGVIIYEMLTGRVPFQAPTPVGVVIKHAIERPSPPHELRKDIPPRLESVVLRALEKGREGRQETAGQLAQEFREALKGGSKAERSLETTLLNEPARLPEPQADYLNTHTVQQKSKSTERIGNHGAARPIEPDETHIAAPVMADDQPDDLEPQSAPTTVFAMYSVKPEAVSPLETPHTERPHREASNPEALHQEAPQQAAPHQEALHQEAPHAEALPASSRASVSPEQWLLPDRSMFSSASGLTGESASKLLKNGMSLAIKYKKPLIAAVVIVVALAGAIAAIKFASGEKKAPLSNASARPVPAPPGMMYVKGGSFMMGTDDSRGEYRSKPAHPVAVGEFFCDVNEVSNDEYQEFIKKTGHSAPVHWEKGQFKPGTGKLPVVNISWLDAKAYAEWANKRLLTEAEWEYAARGTSDTLYPWGNDWSASNANLKEGGQNGPVAVGSYSQGKSWCGINDMVGNVSEWVADDFKPYPSVGSTAKPNNRVKIYRGGSYLDSKNDLLLTRRVFEFPGKKQPDIGFRCAKDTVK